MTVGVVLVMVATLSACGVKSDEHASVVSARDKLYVQVTNLSESLTKVRQELEVTKRDLALEIKAKQAHAVREEQAKQRLKQAEIDLQLALRELNKSKACRK